MSANIEVKNLSKSYNGIKVLDNFNVIVKKGEVFGLLGANGAGKSTSVECILGTRKADSGSVSVLGTNPHSSREELFEMVGVQFQESTFHNKIKVCELCEVTYALYKNPTNYEDLLVKFGLKEHSKKYIEDLSGGQKQRLFIVLALIPNPKVVFLDELTTGLDLKARREVWKILLQLKEEGLTIFLTSHFMDEIKLLCDNICILKKGKTVFQGTVDEAVESSPFENLEDAYLWYADDETEEI